MKNELQELFQLAAKFFIRKYKKKGGAQSILAEELGITQSYLSSVVNGSRSASLELYSQIAGKLYGPLDKFLAVGRRLKEGKEPFAEEEKRPEDPVENLIARLTYYVVDHQRIAKELAELKQFYEAIVEHQPIGIVVTNKDHEIIYMNRHLETIASIPIEKFIGKTPYDAEEKIPGIDIGTLSEKYNEAVASGEKVPFENCRVRKQNGETLYLSGTFIPNEKNGEFDSMLCTLLDTSRSYILKNMLINTLDHCAPERGIGVAQQTQPGKIPKVYFMNKKFRQIFGVEDIDPETTSFDEINKIISTRLKNSRAWLKKLKEGIKENKSDIRITLTSKNNKKFEWISNPLIDDNGHQWGRYVFVDKAKQSPKKKNSTKKSTR